MNLLKMPAHPLKVMFLSFLAIGSVFAETCVWRGAAGDGKWSTAGNWDVRPVSGRGDTVVVSAAGALKGVINNDLGAMSIGKLELTGSTAFELRGGELTLGGEEVLACTATASVSNGCPLVLLEGTNGVSICSGGTLKLGGTISGPGALSVVGASANVGVNDVRNGTSHSSQLYIYGGHTFTGGALFEKVGVRIYSASAFGASGNTVRTGSIGALYFYQSGNAPNAYAYVIGKAATGNAFYLYFAGVDNLAGTITSDSTESYTIYMLSGPGTTTFDGSVVLPNQQLYPAVTGHLKVTGAFTVKSFGSGSSVGSSGGSLGFGSAGNVYGADLPLSYCSAFKMYGANYLDPTTYVCMAGYTKDGKDNAYLDLNGFDQVCRGVYTSFAGDGNNYRNKGHVIKNTSAQPATLNLVGATKDCLAHAEIDDAVSLVWAPDGDRTLTLRDRASTMSGSLVVSNGTVVLDGMGSLAQCRGVEVCDGADFRVALTNGASGALAVLKNLTLGAGATFAVAGDTGNPFGDATCTLHLQPDSVFTLKEGATYAFANVYVGNALLPAGEYTVPNAAHPYFAGSGKVIVQGTVLTSVWTGGAGDGKWSSAGNWQGGLVPASGVKVEVSNPGSSPEIVNDIAGLSLLALEFTGLNPFRLSGQPIAFSSRSALLASATASVTNALDIALPDGENAVNNTGAGRFALAGSFSGTEAKLVLTGGAYALLGANAHGGGTRSESLENLWLCHPRAAGAPGSTLETTTSLEFFVPGTYDCGIVINQTSHFWWHFRKTGDYVISGDVTRTASDGTWYLSSANGTVVNSGTLTFGGKVSMPNTLIYPTLKDGWKVKFLQSTHFKEVWGGSYYSAIGSILEFHETNTVDVFRASYASRMYLETPNAFPLAPPIYFDKYLNSGTGAESGLVDLRGNDQVFDRISNNGQNLATDGGAIQSTVSGKSPTLTLNGTADAWTRALLTGPVSLVWNAAQPTLTQEFADRVHTLSGDLVVSNGVLRFSGATSVKNVTRIVVAAGGRFVLDTTLENALSGVTAIEVAPGGVFEVAAGKTPFADNKIRLDFSTGATFRLPAAATYDFKAIYLDGEALDGNIYGADNLPGVEGGKLIAHDVQTERVDATWNGGAGAVTSIAAGGNWEGGSAPQLSNGTLNALFATGGESADIDQNIDVKGIRFGGSASLFDVTGTGVVAVRDLGIAVEAAHTNAVNAPYLVREEQTWNVGEGSRLDINGFRSGRFGTETVHKTGPGVLRLNAEAGNVGPFTLGSRKENGGSVHVCVGTNAFGTASDDCEIRIAGVSNSHDNQGVRFCTSSVVERPFTLDGENVYYSFVVENNLTVRFTKAFNATGATRLTFATGAHVITEGGGTVGGWTCFAGSGAVTWTVRGKPSTFAYLYLASGPTFEIENAGHTFNGIEMNGPTHVIAAAPYALNTEAMRVYFSNATAVLDVAGDQMIGGFLTMSGGSITSAIPSTVHFNQCDYGKTGYPDRAITNSAVRITGAVTLYKDKGGLFVQDCAADTTGGFGVGAGTLVLTANAVAPNATQYRVEGDGRMEVLAKNVLGRQAALHLDSSAALRLDGDQRVRELYVNGVRQPDGKYKPTAVGGTRALSCLEGPGTLFVGGGFVLSFR